MNSKFHSIIKALFKKIKTIIRLYQGPGAGARKSFAIMGYWVIGRSIAEAKDYLQGEKRVTEQVLQQLANELEPFYGYRFGKVGLHRIYNFYMAFPDWHSEYAELSWTHYTQLLRIKTEEKRVYYLKEALANQWSTRELARQIKSHYYERIMPITDKKKVEKNLLREPFVLEFLGINEDKGFQERELENALLEKLQLFLLELGKGFSFVARQKMITTTTGKRFYIDLVFYHFILKCFVLVDLKVGELTHGDIGQMDMYVRLYEDKWRQPEDNPTIGIILCPEKDETLVKYSILEESQQLFASRYQLYLPTESELTNLIAKDLEQIEMLKKDGV